MNDEGNSRSLELKGVGIIYFMIWYLGNRRNIKLEKYCETQFLCTGNVSDFRKNLAPPRRACFLILISEPNFATEIVAEVAYNSIE